MGFSSQPSAARAVTVSAEYNRREAVSLNIFIYLSKVAAARLVGKYGQATKLRPAS
jgi:hypothetical protein